MLTGYAPWQHTNTVKHWFLRDKTCAKACAHAKAEHGTDSNGGPAGDTAPRERLRGIDFIRTHVHDGGVLGGPVTGVA